LTNLILWNLMTVSPKLSTLSIHEYTVRGYELEKSCKSSAALSVWTEALVHYPDNTVFALRKAVMSLTENRTDAALTALDIAENSLEADLYREQIMDLRRQTRAFMASQHNVAAMDAYNDGLFSLARDEFTALLELSPEHPYALFRIPGAYAALCCGPAHFNHGLWAIWYVAIGGDDGRDDRGYHGSARMSLWSVHLHGQRARHAHR
jgi:tetratricopeptide (TPR) repeat protein